MENRYWEELRKDKCYQITELELLPEGRAYLSHYTKEVIRRIGTKVYETVMTTDLDAAKALDLLLWGEYNISLKKDGLLIRIRKKK